MADQSLYTQSVTIAPGYQAVTLIASVPLSTADWQPFAEGEIVVVSAGRVTPQIAIENVGNIDQQ